MNELGAQLRRAFIVRLALGVTLLSIVTLVILVQLKGDKTIPNITRPSKVIVWQGREKKGFATLGCGGDFIYGVSASRKVLDVWKWNGITLSKEIEQVIPDNATDVNWTKAGLIADYLKADDPGYIELTNSSQGLLKKKWDHPHGWYMSQIQVSANGQYIGLAWGEEPGELAPLDADSSHARTKIGLIGTEQLDLNSAITLVGKDESFNSLVSTSLPSNNGKFMAIAGYGNMLAMVDVANKNHLWTKRPSGEVSLTLAAFAPDSSIVYTGGGSSAVYALDVKSGKILDKWYASPTGKEEAGLRLSTLAVSPDGKWIAAGTGPQGLVFVASTEQAKNVTTLEHGGSTVALVQFSPDSAALASIGSGTIKIWPTTLWDASEKPTATSVPTSQKSLTTSQRAG